MKGAILRCPKCFKIAMMKYFSDVNRFTVFCPYCMRTSVDLKLSKAINDFYDKKTPWQIVKQKEDLEQFEGKEVVIVYDNEDIDEGFVKDGKIFVENHEVDYKTVTGIKELNEEYDGDCIPY